MKELNYDGITAKYYNNDTKNRLYITINHKSYSLLKDLNNYMEDKEYVKSIITLYKRGNLQQRH
jgi:hypothetical protein